MYDSAPFFPPPLGVSLHKPFGGSQRIPLQLERQIAYLFPFPPLMS